MADFVPVTVYRDRLTLYATPGFKAAVVAAASKGDRVEYKPGAVNRWPTDDRQWIVARIGGHEGWLPFETDPVREWFTPPAAPLPTPGAWYWYRPVTKPFTVQSPYGDRVKPEDVGKPPEQQRHELHTGTDYTADDWTCYAAREGTVVIAGWDTSGYGNLVKLDHGGGRTSLYGHLDSIAVTVGQTVTAGQPIGVIGTTGNSTGRHLHFESRLNNVAYGPSDEMRPNLLDGATDAIPEPPLDEADTQELPLPELALTDAERAGVVAGLRWLATVIEQGGAVRIV